ncbi:hypothetical protein F2P56_036664 [Juglans regia]|uniref:CD2 antigen cytoplasmic tail-binding protein 2 n=1 Tax=Juglans regia TaxID=51240 RepID=A0A833TBR4_JUGRE|nr:hypothetical protein F2P56_036664 [Juglans regia]
MEGKSSRPNLKRSIYDVQDDADDDNKPPAQKRVRFPKGKKVKPGDEGVDRGQADEAPSKVPNPRLAAKERAKHRNQITAELFTEESRGIINDVTAAEVAYMDNENFVEDGIQMEPFNLDREREEGYFDADGNFVEYVNDTEIKDAWLDSVDVEPKYAGKGSIVASSEDYVDELSSEDVGKMKRRIVDLLEPGETVLQALRRLKGASNNRKEKMSAETKLVFDQLTEDAMKLMENGEYDVYHEKREVFEREAGNKAFVAQRGSNVHRRYLTVTEYGGGGRWSDLVIPEGYKELGWEKFCVKLRRAAAMFLSIHDDGSRRESQEKTSSHQNINLEVKQTDPSTTMVARRSYAATLKTGHALATQFDTKGKKGNYESGFETMQTTQGQNQQESDYGNMA